MMRPFNPFGQSLSVTLVDPDSDWSATFFCVAPTHMTRSNIKRVGYAVTGEAIRLRDAPVNAVPIHAQIGPRRVWAQN